MQNKINILGINIDNIRKNDLKDIISSLLNSSFLQYIVTPNPEIILKAITDEEYFYIINNASLATADGIGLKFAALVTGNIIPRITGVEITDELLSICNYLQKKVLIVNWEDGLSSDIDIQTALYTKYPDLNFFVHSMSRENDNWKNILNKAEILKYEPDVVICLFGAPYQEKFIYHIAKIIPTVKLAIGVGGAFDFFTNKIKRAPGIFRIIGLEWLWRLIKQPKRWKRIFNAIIVFPYKFLRWYFILPLFYRKNVACLIYKKENNKRFILLVEREDCKDYWQLPQGGTDGEKIETAGQGELFEELNCSKFKFVCAYKNQYKYKFGQRNEDSEYIKTVKKHLGYKGQSQSLYIAEFTGKDTDIRINFWEHTNWKWVPEENVLNTVHECRKNAMKIYLNIFSKIKQ